ncbi:Site-specific recombinase XerD [Enterococcus durans]|uniref:tyrosine-type recombinase/integrase n=1 Tax=Enterococcus TaxID=1350 RepID=UPI000E030B9C|nr:MULTISPECIES: site-specific integrase [Enterococcus]MDO1599886.1 tyrosine-type recombinase/integrase [Enterococcus faecium]NHB73506.1 site-specific integrase [Enterococcus faecium]STP37576.1 Site-specific recombinase XerD [Enterococcus durans]STP39536.1 Site-specific recombinase XerD [Enterococcus durans]
MSKKEQTRKTKYTGVYQNLSNKTFGYRVKLGTDRATGKAITEHRRGFRTASEAHEARTSALKKKHDLGALTNAHMLYEQFMDKYYIPEYRNGVEPSTWKSREGVLLELKEVFGKKKPRDITTLDILDYKNKLLERHSQNYARLKFGMFSRSLKHAKKHGLIKENLVEIVEGIPKKKPEVDFWTKKEFEKVIETFNLNDFYEHMSFSMIFLYYMTGLRVNELTALYWSDIDLENAQIRVYHNLDFTNSDIWTRKTKMKTEAGRRIISLDEDTISVLKEWKKHQEFIGKYDFVISYMGAPLGKSTINRIVRRHAKLAKVKEIQPKGLRHSHASLLINELNANPLAVQKRLGHSDIQITLGTYSHLYPTIDREVADGLKNLISIKTSDKSLVKWNGNQHIKNLE